jgi:hypothetical protein
MRTTKGSSKTFTQFDDPGTDPPGRSRRHHTWAAATALLIVCGVVVSVLAAGAEGRNKADGSRKSLQQSSASVASTLQLALEHESDIVVDAGGLFQAKEGLSQTEFLAWAEAVNMLDRYPEMAGIGSVELVHKADLPAFVARAAADPTGPLPADGTFAIVPPGVRPFYCLVSVTVSRTPTSTTTPPGLDYCADPARSVMLLSARDSGQSNYLPYSAEGKTWLAIQTPIYREGITPTTLRARRAAFAGWVGTELDPTVLLVRALQGHPELSVSMRYHVGPTDVAFTSGAHPTGAESVTVDLHNGWTVQTSASSPTRGSPLAPPWPCWASASG